MREELPKGEGCNCWHHRQLPPPPPPALPAPGPTLNPGVGGSQGPTGRGHTKGVATLRVCTMAHRTLVPWHRGRWQELKALRPEGDEAVGSLPPSATITPADPEGLEAGVPPCGCAESVRRSRWEGAGAGPGPGGLAPESRQTGALTWSPHLHRNWPSVPGPP